VLTYMPSLKKMKDLHGNHSLGSGHYIYGLAQLTEALDSFLPHLPCVHGCRAKQLRPRKLSFASSLPGHSLGTFAASTTHQVNLARLYVAQTLSSCPGFRFVSDLAFRIRSLIPSKSGLTGFLLCQARRPQHPQGAISPAH
jgi:hypothetical protein